MTTVFSLEGDDVDKKKQYKIHDVLTIGLIGNVMVCVRASWVYTL